MPNLLDTNNQGSPPAQSLPLYRRDPEYYFDDGSAVFLVEDVLFKFQASLLAPQHASKITFKTTLLTTITLLDLSDTSENRPGTTDENPIEVPNVRPWTFRVLLLARLGCPGNPSYMRFLTAAQDSENHDKALFLRYLYLGGAAARFGLIELAQWAWLQVKLVLNSATKLDTTKWDVGPMLATLVFYRAMPDCEIDTEYELVAFFRLVLSVSLSGRLIAPQEELVSNLDVCVKLYKEHSK
ncbi:hypothetical protein FS749_015445 [Ceratobasidium sp. UAMH 11750]|nr:hypothetical protein FS749_015445 [Ceratobasidium sp. UAMH 11750]